MARFGLIVTGFLLLVPAANACSVPVFRYALEQWPAARYELLIFHDRPLSEEEREAVHAIKQSAEFANLTLRQIDVTRKLDDNLRAIWDRESKDVALPCLVLRYPDSTAKTPSVWSGSFASLRKAGISDSLARRAIFDPRAQAAVRRRMKKPPAAAQRCE